MYPTPPGESIISHNYLVLVDCCMLVCYVLRVRMAASMLSSFDILAGKLPAPLSKEMRFDWGLLLVDTKLSQVVDEPLKLLLKTGPCSQINLTIIQ